MPIQWFTTNRNSNSMAAFFVGNHVIAQWSYRKDNTSGFLRTCKAEIQKSGQCLISPIFSDSLIIYSDQNWWRSNIFGVDIELSTKKLFDWFEKLKR